MKKFVSSTPKYVWFILAGISAVVVLVIYFQISGQGNKLKIAGGVPGSYFYELAETYKKELAKQGVELEIVQTKGAADNLVYLNEGKVDLGISHGGLTTPQESPNLSSLGSISYEPLWVFQRKGVKPIRDLSQLKGMKVATGLEGSGVAVIAKRLFEAEGVNNANTTIIQMSMKEAEKQLVAGQIDAAVFMDPPENERIRAFFSSSVINEASLDDSEAIRRRFRFLHVLRIPPSGIDLALEQPHSELQTVAPTAYMAARSNLDPAYQYLLLSIMDHIHHAPTLINDEDEFPADKDIDLPLSKDAEIYYKKGKPFLQEYLPFKLASFIERLIKVLLPLLLLAYPIFSFAPVAYNWHIRNKLSKRYDSLIEIEDQLVNNTSNKSKADFEAMLADVEKKLNGEKIPSRFTNEVFILREHIELVQRAILRKLQD